MRRHSVVVDYICILKRCMFLKCNLINIFGYYVLQSSWINQRISQAKHKSAIRVPVTGYRAGWRAVEWSLCHMTFLFYDTITQFFCIQRNRFYTVIEIVQTSRYTNWAENHIETGNVLTYSWKIAQKAYFVTLRWRYWDRNEIPWSGTINSTATHIRQY